MKKVLIVGIILGITILFIGCGSKTKVTEAYTEYIGQAKVEILNGDYDKALQYITLAKDENTGDKVVDELSEQIDMYRKLEKWIWTAEDGNLTEDLYKSIEGQLEEANKFIKRKFESNLMIDNIKSKIEELILAVENEKIMKEEALELEKRIEEEMKISSDIALEMYQDLDNKRFTEANDKSYELESSLNLLDSYGDYFDRNYPLYTLVRSTRKLYNGINGLNAIKEENPKAFDEVLNELKPIAEEQQSGELFIELAADDGVGSYQYYTIFKKSDGNYVYYYRHVNSMVDYGFSEPTEKSNLTDLVNMINGISSEVEWDPSWSAKPDGYYDDINNN